MTAWRILLTKKFRSSSRNLGMFPPPKNLHLFPRPCSLLLTPSTRRSWIPKTGQNFHQTSLKIFVLLSNLPKLSQLQMWGFIFKTKVPESSLLIWRKLMPKWTMFLLTTLNISNLMVKIQLSSTKRTSQAGIQDQSHL